MADDKKIKLEELESYQYDRFKIYRNIIKAQARMNHKLLGYINKLKNAPNQYSVPNIKLEHASLPDGMYIHSILNENSTNRKDIYYIGIAGEFKVRSMQFTMENSLYMISREHFPQEFYDVLKPVDGVPVIYKFKLKYQNAAVATLVGFRASKRLPHVSPDGECLGNSKYIGLRKNSIVDTTALVDYIMRAEAVNIDSLLVSSYKYDDHEESMSAKFYRMLDGLPGEAREYIKKHNMKDEEAW